MGFAHDSLFRLTLLPVLFLCAAGLSAQDNSGVAATLKDFALPEYRDSGVLQFILYGREAVNLGATLKLSDPMLDIVQDDLRDISKVKPLNGIELYPIDKRAEDALTAKQASPEAELGKLEEARKFWDGIPHCRALISSTAATYDKNQKLLRGDTPAHFRSRFTDDKRVWIIDVDGVGFDAWQNSKLIHIRNGVKVVIRSYQTEEDKKSDTPSSNPGEDSTK